MFSRTLHSRLLSMLLSAALTSLVLSTLFSTTLTRPVCAQDAAGHFHYAGPLSKFQVEGATPGAVAGGLPFTVTVADNGATITPSSFDLKGPQWNSAAKLTLDGLKYAGGKLTATARIQNGSGSVLEGVRLDITGATEEYKAKDAQGQETLKTRPQPAALASPLLFGDIAKEDTSDANDVEVSGLAFQPETTKLIVAGVVSGLYYMGSFNDGRDNCNPVSIDVDGKGRVYLVDGNVDSIYRIDADGKNANAVAKLPAEGERVAVDPITGDIWGRYLNSHEFLQFTAGGEDKGKIAQNEDTFKDWPGPVRVDRKGTLYVVFGSTIHRVQNGMSVMQVSSVGSYEFGALDFDPAPDGTLWAVSNDTLFHVDADGKNGKRVAFGPDWRLGKLMAPLAVRTDAQSQVYVYEAMDLGNGEFPRISVFDKNGRLVRVFGRGNRQKKEEGFWPGQVHGASLHGLAFGGDGRVYVTNEDGTDAVLMFQPF